MHRCHITNQVQKDLVSALTVLGIETDVTGQGVLDWDVRTGKVTWDAKWSVLFASSACAGSGNAGVWEKAIHPADLCDVLEKLNEHLSGKSDFFVAEYRLNPACGQPHSVRTSGIVVSRRDNGRPCRVIMASHKIAPLEYTMVRRYESPLTHNT